MLTLQNVLGERGIQATRKQGNATLIHLRTYKLKVFKDEHYNAIFNKY